jgi:hypothetical protein
MSLGLAFLGFGEVGQLFTQQLAGCPGVTIAVYDILFEDRVRDLRGNGKFGTRRSPGGRAYARTRADLHRSQLGFTNDEAPDCG